MIERIWEEISLTLSRHVDAVTCVNETCLHFDTFCCFLIRFVGAEEETGRRIDLPAAKLQTN